MINPFPHAMWRMPYFLHVLELKQTNKQKKPLLQFSVILILFSFICR